MSNEVVTKQHQCQTPHMVKYVKSSPGEDTIIEILTYF